MCQTTFLSIGASMVQIELPDENEQVLPGVHWGNVAAFPSLAYWTYKVLQRRLMNNTVQYKLGRSLLEEVGACLLGGHGIPAYIGLAAYEHLKQLGAFSGEVISEEQLYEWLSAPFNARGKMVKYRFAKQKAKYLADAILQLSTDTELPSIGRELRDRLTKIKGIGLKTASWVARNWMDADDVAILDIHIYRAGLLGGFFTEDKVIEKDYLELEETFINVAKAIGAKASELDAVMWFEMQESPFILDILRSRKSAQGLQTELSDNPVTNQRQPHALQLALV